MANTTKSKTFVVNPADSRSYKIVCNNMVLNRDYYEFTNETGIIAYVPACVSVVEETSLTQV